MSIFRPTLTLFCLFGLSACSTVLPARTPVQIPIPANLTAPLPDLDCLELNPCSKGGSTNTKPAAERLQRFMS